MSKQPIGVYCLANDVVYHWFAAFVRSLRLYAPQLPLIVVPFDSRMERVSALQKKFDFTLMEAATLKKYEAFGREFFPNNSVGANTFRKFSIFDGDFDRFLFFDADIVLMESPELYFDLDEKSACDLLYFESEPNAVFLPGELRKKVEAEGGSLINTGAFLSRRNGLTWMDLQMHLAEGKKLEAQFAPTAEQPYFNYCLFQKKLRLCSVRELRSDLTSTVWAGEKAKIEADRLQGKQLPFLHWAGYGASWDIPYRATYLHHRLRDASPTDCLRTLGYLLRKSLRKRF